MFVLAVKLPCLSKDDPYFDLNKKAIIDAASDGIILPFYTKTKAVQGDIEIVKIKDGAATSPLSAEMLFWSLIRQGDGR